MNKQEALSRFVKEHLKELTDRQLTRQQVKTLRQEFFDRHHLSAGERFDAHDVALAVVQLVCRAKRGLPREEIRASLATPFISETLQPETLDELVDHQELGKGSSLTTEDLRHLREDSFASEVAERFRAEANAEAEARLAEDRAKLDEAAAAIKERSDVLASIEETLESTVPSIHVEEDDEYDEGTEAGLVSSVWWSDLGLESDPFPNNRGLDGIPSEKYEGVVVQTPFVRSYLSRFELDPAGSFGKTLVVLGEFGSGKTTLLELIASRAGRTGIFPIYAFMRPDAGVFSLTSQLAAEIRLTLREHFRQFTDDSAVRYSDPADEFAGCILAMKSALTSSPASKGFLILIDGLHLPESFRVTSLQFLELLQTFQERLSYRKIPCIIIVAGSDTWESDLRGNLALSGSFSDLQIVPPLSEENAVEAVVKRIEAFVPAGKPKPSIAKAQLRRSFQILSERLKRAPTFRLYLDDAKERFVTREYARVGLSVALHPETVERVQAWVRGSRLGTRYRRLVDPAIRSASFRRLVRRVLPMMLSRPGISEEEPLYKRHFRAFYLLRREGFIVPRKSPSGVGVTWYLSEPLIGALELLSKENRSIGASEALEAMFTDVEERRTAESATIYGPVRRELDELASVLRTGWPEIAGLLDDCRHRVGQLEEASAATSGLETESSLENLKRSVADLLRSILFVTGDRSAATEWNPSRFGELWCAPEYTDDLIQLLHRTRPLSKNPSECYGLLIAHAENLGDLCKLLEGLIKGEDVARLTGRLLSSQDAIELHQARVAFLTFQYEQCINALRAHLEAKIRDVVFPALRAYAGPSCLNLLPSDIAERFDSPPGGHARLRRTWDRNFFYGLNRSEYAKVLFSRKISGLLFHAILETEERVRLADSMALLFSLGDREAHDERPEFFRDHTTEIADALRAAPRLSEVLNKVILNLLTGPEFKMQPEGEDSAVFTFGPPGGSYHEWRIGAREVSNGTLQILERLSRDPVRIPPLEPALIGLNADFDHAMIILRACMSREFVVLEIASPQFSVRFGISDRGRERLDRLRARPTPRADE